MAVDLAPVGQLLLVAATIAALPLAWWWLRHRAKDITVSMAALTALVLFLTFDLIVFGAFTRLTDSGLGCPDWPGCYGSASPAGATGAITAAQTALPDGPVTWTKAWIEMIHRYLAMTVGALILAMAVVAWRARPTVSVVWPMLTLVWVIVQGLFGKFTVTMKLFPAVVTAHLLGGLLLLAMLVAQLERLRATVAPPYGAAAAGLRSAAAWTLGVVGIQAALGGWVSTNYAVLACRGFPQCNDQWWPPMAFEAGFELWRPLGQGAAGHFVPVEALVAIHMVHRLFAVVALFVVGWLCLRLWRHGTVAGRRAALGLVALLGLQLLSGLSNVVLDWPLVAALMHSAGAAALVALLTSVAMRPAT
ncbi:MAG: COX15/CtaA family protein [Aquabacterium sp.]